MSTIIQMLQEFYSAVLQYKEMIIADQDKIELTLLDELLTNLLLATQNKQSECQVTFQEIVNIRKSCCPFKHLGLTMLAVESIQPYCEAVLKERKLLMTEVLDFIHDYKAIRNKDNINLKGYSPEIFDYLRQLFATTDILPIIEKTLFAKLFIMVKQAQSFSYTDLSTWARTNLFQDEKLLKNMIICEKAVERKIFPADEYKLDPLVAERFQRQSRYRKTQSGLTTPTGKVSATVSTGCSQSDSSHEQISESVLPLLNLAKVHAVIQGADLPPLDSFDVLQIASPPTNSQFKK